MNTNMKHLIFSLVLTVVVSACTPDNSAAPTAQTPAASEVTPIAGISGTYLLDPKHTDIIAQWNHFGFSNPSLHFGQVEGKIVYDADNVAASSVEASIPLSGLEAYIPDFNGHLLSADFFAADAFPSVTFKSTAVEVAGTNQLKVTGDLTIKDITHPVVLDVTVNGFAEHPMSKRLTTGFDAVTTIKRSDFGMGAYTPHVSDEVRLRITTEAAVPAAETVAEG